MTLCSSAAWSSICCRKLISSCCLTCASSPCFLLSSCTPVGSHDAQVRINFAQTQANTPGKAFHSIPSLPGKLYVLSLCPMQPTVHVSATHSTETAAFVLTVTALSSFTGQGKAATVMAANVALVPTGRPAGYSNKQHKPAFHAWLAGLGCGAAEAREGPPPSASPEPGPVVLHLPSQLQQPGWHLQMSLTYTIRA